MKNLLAKVGFLMCIAGFSQNIKQITWEEEKSKYMEHQSGTLMDHNDFKKSSLKKAHLEHFTIESNKINQKGAWEICVSYRNFKKNINFVTSHSGLNFGVHDGSLYIKYYYENENNEVFHITQSHIWSIPSDDNFRIYRFKFDPKTKKASIMVDDDVVWELSALNQFKVFWHEEDKILFADGHIHESNTPYFKKLALLQF